ncbi:phBC6A51 family helix-turn-helix protein [Paenibacillus xylanexedens]|uniref:phBC6A51 family helix-turn-helix protein n=1 Tax=Paenibacillus xylanexedens TaxID=528191 RepID=UPI000F538782|nr:phBC6A51 family helix-turn-helix protein [Paenibacillus xylanexedens]RPK16430.1 hypothetical protein EDO6_03091 [Paenibacillus xylanexedens]
MKYALTAPDSQLSSEQLIVAEYLATPGRGGLTMEEVAAEVNVSARTVHRWRLDPIFAKYVQQRTLSIVGERLPDIVSVVADRAIDGSGKHAELFLKMSGVLKDHHVVQPIPPDERDDASIQASIKELRKELNLEEDF